MAPALTASGGDTIPPNKNPKANENPGIKELAKKATAVEVKNTTRKEKLPMILYHRFSPLNEIDQAASNKSGGKITKKPNQDSAVFLEQKEVN